MKIHDKIAEIGLKETKCALNHFPYEPPNAVNYLVQLFTGFEIRIPICQECLDGLQDWEWVLLYCINCCNSQWINKSKSKKQHLYKVDEHIKWLEECPKCTKKGG